MSEQEIEYLARCYEGLQSFTTMQAAEASRLGYHETVTVLGRMGQAYGSLATVLREKVAPARVDTTEVTER